MSMVDELRPEYFYGVADDENLEDTKQEAEDTGGVLETAYLYDSDDSDLEWYQK